ncbi:transporter substrate-binding domain-containing protein [Massilia sp. PWRC2]|uniref:transporter substrate-binding domain-containing protein n=1 Tax=Massilia sp. PWRC2 TaxID=2804626 RepID=UPI003CF6E810
MLLACPAALRAAFAPTGVLRAAINLGNPLLARRADGDAAGAASGVSVDLAGQLARLLEAPLELLLFDTASGAVEAVSTAQADLGFFAIDPLRAAHIAFSPAYLLIEGFYLVRQGSPISSNAEVDRPGQRVVVGKGSAYDLYLTRTLQQAQIERAPSSQEVVATFLAGGAGVAAGVRQQLEADSAGIDGLRLLGQRFMVIEQAMGVPKQRGAEVAAWLTQFVEQMKSSGAVAQALVRHGVTGAVVAPAA